jgi:hypothetical protein
VLFTRMEVTRSCLNLILTFCPQFFHEIKSSRRGISLLSANLLCMKTSSYRLSDHSFRLLGKPTKYICRFLLRSVNLWGNDRVQATLDASTRTALKTPGNRLIMIGLADVDGGATMPFSTLVPEHQVISGFGIRGGKYALFLTSSLYQVALLKRAYSLALPRALGPANLAMSIEDMLVGPDVYSTPVEPVEELRERLSSVSVVQPVKSVKREVLTFEWPNDGKIKNPARGKDCTHFQCFDLEVNATLFNIFLESN